MKRAQGEPHGCVPQAPSLLNPLLAGRVPTWPTCWAGRVKLFQPALQGAQLPYPLSVLLLSLFLPSFQPPQVKQLRLQERAGSLTVQLGPLVQHTMALARLSSPTHLDASHSSRTSQGL